MWKVPRNVTVCIGLKTKTAAKISSSSSRSGSGSRNIPVDKRATDNEEEESSDDDVDEIFFLNEILRVTKIMKKLEIYKQKCRDNRVDWSSYCSPVVSETQLEDRSNLSSSVDEQEEALFRELNELCTDPRAADDVRRRQNDEVSIPSTSVSSWNYSVDLIRSNVAELKNALESQSDAISRLTNENTKLLKQMRVKERELKHLQNLQAAERIIANKYRKEEMEKYKLRKNRSDELPYGSTGRKEPIMKVREQMEHYKNLYLEQCNATSCLTGMVHMARQSKRKSREKYKELETFTETYVSDLVHRFNACRNEFNYLIREKFTNQMYDPENLAVCKIVERNARLAHDNSRLKWDLEKLRRDFENYKHRVKAWKQKEKLIQEHNRKKELLNTKNNSNECNNQKNNNDTKKTVVVTATPVAPKEYSTEKKVKIEEKTENKDDENITEKQVSGRNDKNNELIKNYDKCYGPVDNNNRDVNVKQSKSLIMRSRKETSSVIGGKTVLEIRDFAVDMAEYRCRDFIECTQFASSVQGSCEAIRVCSAPRLMSLSNTATCDGDENKKKINIDREKSAIWWK